MSAGANNVLRDSLGAARDINDSLEQSRRNRTDVAAVDHSVVPSRRLLMAHDPINPYCEKIRTLRTELALRKEPSERGDVVALVSPGAEEGRSLLAAELAIAFAQTGCSTLLVDTDFRHSQQHEFFGTDNRQGLAQVIEYGGEPLLHVVRGIPHLRILSAGVTNSPLELLSGNRFAAQIDAWRDQFQVIVIDTAPVNDYLDGLAVARLVGKVLAVSRAQHTSAKEMQSMLQRLAVMRTQVTGAVINHF